MLCGVHHMMVVVPVNTNVDETKYVADKYWQQWFQGGQRIAVGYLHLQYHNGDDYGNDAIAERFQSSFAHSSN